MSLRFHLSFILRSLAILVTTALASASPFPHHRNLAMRVRGAGSHSHHSNPSGDGGESEGQSCTSGSLQCCNHIAEPDSNDSTSGTISNLPESLKHLGVPLGIDCLPWSIFGANSAGGCASQAACCKDVDSSSEMPVGVDCSPVNVGF